MALSGFVLFYSYMWMYGIRPDRIQMGIYSHIPIIGTHLLPNTRTVIILSLPADTMADANLNGFDTSIFDEDMFAEKTPDTAINFVPEVTCTETVGQQIVDNLRARQPLLLVHDSLKQQKENCANSQLLAVSFKPVLGHAGNHAKLDSQFSELVIKHRNNLISDLSSVLEREVRTHTTSISTMYADEITRMKDMPRDTIDKFVLQVRTEKNALEKSRLEAKARRTHTERITPGDGRTLGGETRHGNFRRGRGTRGRGGYRPY